MDSIVIGTGFASIAEVEKTIRESGSYSELLQRWVCLSRSLELDDSKIVDLESKVRSQIIQLEDILGNILRSWKAKAGSQATLGILCNSLTETGLRHIAESLTSKFQNVMTEPECPNKFELCDNCVFVLENGTVIDLSQANEETTQILIDLIKKQLWKPPCASYYIPRTLSQRSMLKCSVFTDTASDHKFYLSGNVNIETVTKIVGEGSERLILKQNDKGVDGNVTKYVHHIEYINQRFYWIGSSCGFGALHKYFETDGQGKEIEELDLVIQMSDALSHKAICISDSPGMGKTYLLSNLSEQLQQRRPKTVVLFVVFDELMKHVSNIKIDQVDKDIVIEALACCTCRDAKRRPLFKFLLNTPEHKFSIFFDGFDELPQEQRKRAEAFLKIFMEMKNVQICVATRPHIQIEMEELLNTKAFSILPLSKSNQVKFLTDEWCRIYNVENSPYLKRFAGSCLSKLQTRMTKEEFDIAGVPLQCAMLAEAYAGQAEVVLANKTDLGVEVNINSIFVMYKSLVGKRFMRVSTSEAICSDASLLDPRKRWINEHIYQALLRLFPDFVEQFKKHFVGKIAHLNYNEMYTIGLIEKSPHVSAPRFIHQTYAEYMFAEFLVRKLGKCSSVIRFVFKNIFGTAGVKIERNTNRNRHRAYKLHYPVIAYFFDRHLNDYLTVSQKLLDYELISNQLMCLDSYEENICFALASTSSNDLENSYMLAERVFRNLHQRDFQKWIALCNTHFKNLPHCIIEHAKSLKLVQNVLRLTKSEFQASLCFHVYHPIPRIDISKYDALEAYIFPWVPNCTPLHVAIYHGNWPIFKHLVEYYGKDVRAMKSLLHVCVKDSVNNSSPIVISKKKIIRYLVKRNPHFLEEGFENSGVTPLLQERVNLELLETLVKCGANINAHSKFYGTVIHQKKTPGNEIAFSKLLDWATANNFNQFGFRDQFGNTPLLSAVRVYGAVDSDALDLFHRHGADFNDKDKKMGYSVLFYAACVMQCTKLLGKIIEYGANVNHIANNGDTVAHAILRRLGNSSATGISSKTMQVLLNFLVTNGFSLINQLNAEGLTPLHFAVRFVDGECEILDYLQSIGANFNAVDAENDSILFHAISYSRNSLCIKKIIKNGGSVLHKDLKDRTALHVATRFGNFVALNVLLEHDETDVNAQDKNLHTPLHRVFLTENKENSNVLELLLKNNASFSVVNAKGHAPLLSWIEEGKVDFSVLVVKKDILPIDPDLASKALSLLIIKVDSFRKHFSDKIKMSALCEFINFLIDKGGKLRLKNENLFEWTRLSFVSRKFIDYMILLTPELQCQISLRVSTIDQNASSGTKLTSFIRQYDIPVEILLKSLLGCRDKTPFINLCLLLTGQRKKALAANMQFYF